MQEWLIGFLLAWGKERFFFFLILIELNSIVFVFSCRLRRHLCSSHCPDGIKAPAFCGLKRANLFVCSISEAVKLFRVHATFTGRIPGNRGKSSEKSLLKSPQLHELGVKDLKEDLKVSAWACHSEHAARSFTYA